MTEMIDMSRFVEAKSDQLNADDLLGGPRTITVTRVTGTEGDQPISIHYEGDCGKPFKPCKTVRRILLAIWGPYASDYIGRAMTVFRDDSVTFGGLATGGIRVSHMSHMDGEKLVVVMKSKGKKAGIKVHPLATQASAPDELSLALAEKSLRSAGTLDDLKTAWSRKSMAPHRTALQGVLDECKALLSFDANPTAAEGPSEEQRGEAHSGADDAFGGEAA